MGIFEDIEITWKGETYTIKSHRVLGAIANIEEVITVTELQRYVGQRDTLPLAKLSQAYGRLLRYAGMKNVSDDEVYVGLGADKGVTSTEVLDAMLFLVQTMTPGMHKKKKTNPEEEGKKDHPLPGNQEPTATSSETPIN